MVQRDKLVNSKGRDWGREMVTLQVCVIVKVKRWMQREKVKRWFFFNLFSPIPSSLSSLAPSRPQPPLPSTHVFLQAMLELVPMQS